MDTTRLVIKDVIGSLRPTTVADGETMYGLIRSVIYRGGTVEVSYEGLELAATPVFVSAMVADLYENFPEDVVDRAVTFVGAEGPDRVVLENAREAGIAFRRDPDLRNRLLPVSEYA